MKPGITTITNEQYRKYIAQEDYVKHLENELEKANKALAAKIKDHFTDDYLVVSEEEEDVYTRKIHTKIYATNKKPKDSIQKQRDEINYLRRNLSILEVQNHTLEQDLKMIPKWIISIIKYFKRK